MAFTGNWLRAAQQTQANPTQLKEASPRHGQDQSDPYPQDHLAPVGPDYGDTDFMRTVVQTPGLPLDAPDARSHDGPGRGGAFHNQAERQALQQRGHEGQDRGWVRSTYVGRQSQQDDTTRYLQQDWTGNGSPAPTPEAIQRGINSLPQNNPDVEGYDPGGYRRGLRSWRFIDRKNRIDPRVYTAQQLLAREIRIPAPQPAQNGTWGRTSPFASMARSMDTVAVRPGLFRSPPGLTDTVLADESAAAGDGGIATDGMWSV
jgi:hypothetical protein